MLERGGVGRKVVPRKAALPSENQEFPGQSLPGVKCRSFALQLLFYFQTDSQLKHEINDGRYGALSDTCSTRVTFFPPSIPSSSESAGPDCRRSQTVLSEGLFSAGNYRTWLPAALSTPPFELRTPRARPLAATAPHVLKRPRLRPAGASLQNFVPDAWSLSPHSGHMSRFGPNYSAGLQGDLLTPSDKKGEHVKLEREGRSVCKFLKYKWYLSPIPQNFVTKSFKDT